MKRLIKKGFSIIELLFVMVILAALAAIAIQRTSSTELASMRSDMKNIIASLQLKYADKQDYALVVPSAITGAVADYATGLYVSGDLRIPVTKGNIIDIKVVTNTGTCTNEKDSELVDNGFEIKIYNMEIPDKAIKFNSCTDNKIELIDIK